jgi:hypothetical protein
VALMLEQAAMICSNVLVAMFGGRRISSRRITSRSSIGLSRSCSTGRSSSRSCRLGRSRCTSIAGDVRLELARLQPVLATPTEIFLARQLIVDLSKLRDLEVGF